MDVKKIYFLSLFFIFTGGGLASFLKAQPGPGDQGYGVMLGNPTGLSGKVWLTDRLAFDGAFGIARSELDMHISLLIHDEGLLRQLGIQSPSSTAYLPVYFGIGPRILFEEDEELGIRIPIGISYFPNDDRWELFGEVAPVVRLTPDTGLNGDFAIGFRYYFAALRPNTR